MNFFTTPLCCAGTDLEIKHSLLTFGINGGHMFQSARGTGDAGEKAKNPNEQSYIQHRREIEKREAEHQAKEEAKSGIFLYPKPFDVLVGRGRPYREYSGNRRLGSLIDEHLERYRIGDRFQKSCILLDVVKSVHEYKGRFLQKTSGGWVVVAEKVAREKVAKGFRFKMGKDDGTDDADIPVATHRSVKRYKPDPRLDSSMK
jgi:hypothetical protein